MKVSRIYPVVTYKNLTEQREGRVTQFYKPDCVVWCGDRKKYGTTSIQWLLVVENEYFVMARNLCSLYIPDVTGFM